VRAVAELGEQLRRHVAAVLAIDPGVAHDSAPWLDGTWMAKINPCPRDDSAP
jgi:hypothetical protein